MKAKSVEEMYGIVHLIKREINKRVNIELTSRQGMILQFLGIKTQLNEDVFQRDIEEEFNIRRSTVTIILRGMEEKGLIKRESVKSDARLKKVLMTEKSINLMIQFEKAMNDIKEELTYGIDEEEMKAFRLTVDKMRNNLIKK